MEEKLRKQFEKEGKIVLPKEESKVSDSNVITPGTEFMYMLSKKLESYIRQRISGSTAWSNIKVYLKAKIHGICYMYKLFLQTPYSLLTIGSGDHKRTFFKFNRDPLICESAKCVFTHLFIQNSRPLLAAKDSID